MKKRIYSVVLVLALIAGVIATANIIKSYNSAVVTEEETVTEYDKESVYLWYSDKSMENYLRAAAAEYNEKNNARVIVNYQPQAEYLKEINQSTIKNNVPDLFVVSHEKLGTAYQAGLAEPILLSEAEFDNLYFGQAKNAVTYKDMLMGYPLCYETSVLLYNEYFLKQLSILKLDEEFPERLDAILAQNTPEPSQSPTPTPTATPIPTATPTPDPKDDAAKVAQAMAKAKENAEPTATPIPTATPTPEPTPARFTDEEIYGKLTDLLPSTMDELTALGDSYDATMRNESVMKWDVSDVFYNYFFLGDSISVGGDAGWDTSHIEIYNLNAIKSLEAYQKLNAFFSMDTTDCTYEQIMQEFIEGKIVFTIATSDAVELIESAIEQGIFADGYGVTLIPAMSDTLGTRAMSETSCIAINPYSKHTETANDFARFVTTEYADKLYSLTCDRENGISGKLSVASNVAYEYPAFGIFAEEYARSIPLPKMTETSNFWINLEAVFASVWNGEEPNKLLRNLAEQMMLQATGSVTTFDVIEVPVEESEEEEELDEAALSLEDTSSEEPPE